MRWWWHYGVASSVVKCRYSSTGDKQGDCHPDLHDRWSHPALNRFLAAGCVEVFLSLRVTLHYLECLTGWWLILYTVCRRSVGGVWSNLPGCVYLGGKISAATGALYDGCCWPCTSIAVASFSVALRCNGIRVIAEEATLSGGATVVSSSLILNLFWLYSDHPPSSAWSPDLFEV